ncbi:MAG: glycosyltransferase [bacterium]|nr:glycosyltransferase [bacterium]
MRVGLFTDAYTPLVNGVSTSVMMLKTALEKAGHQVFIVTVNYDGFGNVVENDGKLIRLGGVPTGIYETRLTSVYSVRAIKKIKKWKLDVIHSHTEFGVGTFGRFVAKQFNIPLVHTYHTMYEDYIYYITHGYFDGLSKKLVEYFTLFYCDKTATELIVVSKKAYSLFKDKYNVNKNIHIIPTGIEIESFFKKNFTKKAVLDLRVSYGLDRDDFVILFVGRVATEKSIDVLIEGQKEIVKKYPHVKLVIMGDGPDMEKLKELTNKLKVDKNVIFIGKVELHNRFIHYQLPDVFATASRSETQGLTVIESMAASVPVVAADDDNFKEVVVDDLNGYLFSDKKDYVKKIEILINDKEKLSFLSKQALITAKKHDIRHYADDMVEVYNCALKNMKKSNLLDKMFGDKNE